jgi:hypothetical protein
MMTLILIWSVCSWTGLAICTKLEMFNNINLSGFLLAMMFGPLNLAGITCVVFDRMAMACPV